MSSFDPPQPRTVAGRQPANAHRREKIGVSFAKMKASRPLLIAIAPKSPAP
jgi:hypothetical protein